jgi:hypothetical protein
VIQAVTRLSSDSNLGNCGVSRMLDRVREMKTKRVWANTGPKMTQENEYGKERRSRKVGKSNVEVFWVGRKARPHIIFLGAELAFAAGN